MPEPRKTAGAFDVRTIIGGLLGAYGLILLALGIFADTAPASPDAPEGTGINANLWAGLALLAAAAFFLAWWRLRPIVVDEGAAEGDDDATGDRPQH